MKVACQYFNSNVRLAANLSSLSTENCFHFYCLNGSVSCNKDKFKVISEHATVLISCISKTTHKSLLCLLTTDPSLTNRSGTVSEIDDLIHANSMYTLCTFLMEKFKVTGNTFEIEFCGDPETAFVTPLRDEDTGEVFMSCTLRGQGGDLLVLKEDVIQAALSKCHDPKFFSFSSITPDIDKTVTVKRPYGEIYKEIARYLNRTIVLVSFSGDNEFLEQYISSAGILECVTIVGQGVKRFRKVQSRSIRHTAPFSVYLTTASIEDTAKQQGHSLKRPIGSK